jgi:hypothetical protein
MRSHRSFVSTPTAYPESRGAVDPASTQLLSRRGCGSKLARSCASTRLVARIQSSLKRAHDLSAKRSRRADYEAGSRNNVIAPSANTARTSR